MHKYLIINLLCSEFKFFELYQKVIGLCQTN